MKKIIGSKYTFGVRYQIEKREANSKEFKPVYKGHNLVLDSGLNLVASNVTSMLTRYLALGTGTGPTERDSSTTTCSRTGSTVTASGNFFEAGDVGRLIKWNTGEEAYILSFTSATEVETVDSGAIASDEFTIYYVDDNTLGSQTERSANYVSGGANNGTSQVSNVITHKRTFLSNVAGAPITFNEIGWSPLSGTGNLFSRDVISGGISLTAGDQLRVITELDITQGPATPSASSPSGIAGSVQVEGCGLTTVQSSGAGNGPAIGPFLEGVCEPAMASSNIYASAYSGALAAYNTNVNVYNAVGYRDTAVGETYVNGNFYRDVTRVFTTSQANGTLRSFGLCNFQSGAEWRSGLRFLSDSGVVKTSSQTLTLTMRWSWQRELVNT